MSVIEKYRIKMCFLKLKLHILEVVTKLGYVRLDASAIYEVANYVNTLDSSVKWTPVQKRGFPKPRV